MRPLLRAAEAFMRGGETTEKPHPVGVNALLASLQGDASDTGARVTIEGTASRPYVGRPQALKRCLGNLLDNAITYGNTAKVLVEDRPDRLVVRITIEAPASPKRMERVFEPFRRLEASRSRDTGGTGPGLSIARQIARVHGGELSLKNLKDGGLEAELTFPRR